MHLAEVDAGFTQEEIRKQLDVRFHVAYTDEEARKGFMTWLEDSIDSPKTQSNDAIRNGAKHVLSWFANMSLQAK